MATHLKRVPAERESPLRRLPPIALYPTEPAPHARRQRKRRKKAGKPGLGGPAAKGVNTAYRVVEEYMRVGYQAAREYERVINQERTMGHNDRHSGCERDYWNPMEAMMAPWIQMSRAWLDTMSCFVPGVGRAGSAWAGRAGECSCGCGASSESSCRSHRDDSDRCPCGCGAYSWMECRGGRRVRRKRRSRRIVLQITSDRYADGCLRLDSEISSRRIVVDSLTFTDINRKVHSIVASVSKHSSGKTFIRVGVPRGVPAGEYRGNVYCNDEECGEVWVCVYDNDPIEQAQAAAQAGETGQQQKK